MAPLGKGTMGMVYRARDTSLDREVALKLVAPELVKDAETLERFQREAKAAARLQHPSIVTIYELGQDRGVHYIAMELLGGADLEEMMAPGRLRLDQKLRLMTEVCRALHFAHQRGVVHRDVKPANIRVLGGDAVKIVDFGIAHLADSQLTKSGVVLGTPTYLAPEILAGAKVDHRSDMWSVGVILYEIAGGRPPYDGLTFAVLARSIVNDPLPPLRSSGLPPGLPALVDRALAKQPHQRFRDMGEMAEALHDVVFLSRQAATPASDAVRQKAHQRNLEEARAYLARDDLSRALQAAQRAAAQESPPGEGARLAAEIQQRLAEGETAPIFRAVHPSAPPPPLTAVPAGPTPATPSRVAASPRRPSLAALLRERGPSAYREAAVFGEPPHVQTVAASPAGDLLATAGADGVLRIWNLREKRPVLNLRTDMQRRAGHEARAMALAFSPDASLLASGHLDGSIHLWDLRRGEEVPVRLRHDAVTSLAFPPTGAVLASGGMDSALKLWDVAGAREGNARRELHRQPVGVTALAFTASGLATGHPQGLIRLHDAQSLRLVATLRGARALVSFLAPSPGGRALVVGGQDRTLSLIDLPSGAASWTVAPHRRPVASVAFLPCGTVLATTALESVVHLLEAGSGSVLGSLCGRLGEGVVGLAAQGDGGLATALGDGCIRLWAPAAPFAES